MIDSLLLDTYVEYVNRVFPKYNTVDLSPREKVLLNSFIETNGKNMSSYDIVEYVGFQFHYYKEKQLRSENRRYPIHWIFGDKSFSRWKNASDGHRHLAKQFIASLGFKLNAYTQTLPKVVQVLDYEEKVKSLFFNDKEKGLANCVVNTTLYKDRSSFCRKCEFVDRCKQVLREQFPNIYILRGYAKNSTQG